MKNESKTISPRRTPLTEPARDAGSLSEAIANRLVYTVGKDALTATLRDWFYATAYVARDRLIERWMETMRSYYDADAKRVYYLSMEFLMGRTLMNSLLNLGFEPGCRAALQSARCRPAGRCARSNTTRRWATAGSAGSRPVSSIRWPRSGCRATATASATNTACSAQRIENGRQVEHPDNWLRYGNPWEFPRPEVLYPVKFGGRVVEFADEQGALRHHWVDTEDVMAMAYDTPIPGYDTDTVNNMRLWSAKASRDFDLKYFNEGNYIRAVEDKNESENLSKVLYPDDSTEMGRELRLKQQYFFVCASLQDILYRFTKYHHGVRRAARTRSRSS